MQQSIAKEVACLRQMRIGALQSRYAEFFGEETRAGNKAWLIKRITWRIQALEEGDLSERARQRAAEIACDADLRLSPPKPRRGPRAAPEPTQADTIPVSADERLPPPGSILSRLYKGQQLQVLVLPDGFEYAGQIYRSLSALFWPTGRQIVLTRKWPVFLPLRRVPDTKTWGFASNLTSFDRKQSWPFCATGH